MVGLVRRAGWNPLALGLGHQVVAFRYEETAAGFVIGVYDPNYPGNDDVTITVERRVDGTSAMSESPAETVIGLLALPVQPGRRQLDRAGASRALSPRGSRRAAGPGAGAVLPGRRCPGWRWPRSQEMLRSPVARLSTAPAPIAKATPTDDATAPVTRPPIGVEPAKTVV